MSYNKNNSDCDCRRPDSISYYDGVFSDYSPNTANEMVRDEKSVLYGADENGTPTALTLGENLQILDGQLNIVGELGAQIDDDNISTATTYSSRKITDLIESFVGFAILIVDELPAIGESNTIYLLRVGDEENNIYDEYLYINDAWEKIGSTRIDLSAYYTKTETDTLLGKKQDRLTAGKNIVISGNVISATDTVYNAGTHIEIDSANTISANYQASDFDIKNLSDSEGLKDIWSGKQDALEAGENIIISGNVISATDTTYEAGDHIEIDSANTISANYEASDFDIKNLSDSENLRETWSGKQDVLEAGENITISGNVISATDTTYSAGGHIDINSANTISANYQASDFDIKDLTDSDGLRDTWSGKQDALSAGTNIVISGNVISATDTTYEAGENISISGNVISATDTVYSAGTHIEIDSANTISANYESSDFDIKDLSDSDGLRETWSNKQDALSAGTNITISGNVISATDTVYSAGTHIEIDSSNTISSNYEASDFDIKDLTDSDGLREEWSGKQDALEAGENITISGNVISAEGGIVYEAGENISIDSANTISALGYKYDEDTQSLSLKMDSNVGAVLPVILGSGVTDLDSFRADRNGAIYAYGVGGFEGYGITSANTIQSEINRKQDQLSAGNGIEINENVISSNLIDDSAPSSASTFSSEKIMGLSLGVKVIDLT